jgi:predicted PurR-regulated permease PerM
VRIKNLSPLTNHLDGFIMRRFADLSTVLTISVLGVAILQGLTFALLMSFFDLPALFLGIAFAMASFIPIVGGALIWLPVAVYFVISDQVSFAIITALYSVLLIGILIDNLLRPIIIRKLSSLRGAKGNEQSILSHTWLTMLSTLAGLIHFGVMGLVFGPMLAAMAITIFDVYEHKHRHQLDYS